ncbi:hypothetical protein A5768_25935 [Mycolicibacterium fortuitum]|nr:hypothetical protein A5768_25935 [Mycolicibacterium fortuitum]
MLVGLTTACRVVRKIDTDPLEVTISAMPGVAKAWVSFDEDELDSIATLNVQMPGADAGQISDVAQAVSSAHGDGSADYLKRLRLRIGDAPAVTALRDVTSLNAAVVVTDSTTLRSFAAVVASTSPAAQIDWATDNRLTVRQLTTPVPEVLQALRDVGVTASTVHLLPVDSAAPSWRVTLPLSRDQEQRIHRQIAAMPAQLVRIAVRDATITDLGVVVSRQAAHRALVDIISIVGAGPGHPLWLTWHLAPRDITQQYDGSVHVGGCDYPDSRLEQQPENYLSAEEIELQDRLRAQFDTCPR